MRMKQAHPRLPTVDARPAGRAAVRPSRSKGGGAPPDVDPALPPDRQGVRERLIRVAIDQIEREGIARLTVRKVAAEAGANIAAVNYYFRSKDALVSEALAGTIQNLMEDMAELLAKELDARKRLSGLFTYLLDGGLRYPGIVRAQLFDGFCSGDYSGPFATRFAPVVDRIAEAIREASDGLERAGSQRRALATLSALFFPVAFSGLFRASELLASPAGRRAYVEEIVRIATAPRA